MPLGDAAPHDRPRPRNNAPGKTVSVSVPLLNVRSEPGLNLPVIFQNIP